MSQTHVVSCDMSCDTEVLRACSLPLPDNIPVLILEVLRLNKLLCISSDFKFNKHRALATDMRSTEMMCVAYHKLVHTFTLSFDQQHL